jgi:methionine synthase II (cobalamin-independent)
MSLHLEAGSISLYLRDKELRRYVFPYYFWEKTDDRRLLLGTIRELFTKYLDADITYRSTGITLGDFREARPKQLSLLDIENTTSEKSKHLAGAIEKINKKFWKNLITLGVLGKNTPKIEKKFTLPVVTAC